MKSFSLALVLGWLPTLAQVSPPTLPYFPENSPTTLEVAGDNTESTSPANPDLAANRDSRVPGSTAQLYQQRLAALSSGTLYTRLPRHSFQAFWENARETPTYEDWTALLGLEAKAIASGQGENRLCVTIGDSLTLWLRPGLFVGDNLWLNQGIGGDNTARIRHRVSLLQGTRPNSIFLMIGVNDLIAGRSNADILTNYDDIVGQLRDNHPDARIVVQSILPTDHHAVSNDRVRAINQQLAQMAQRHDAMYLDLYPHFSDEAGRLRAELTTDGIHLSDFGYEVWQSFLRQMDAQIAREERHSPPVHNVEEFHQNQSAQGVGM